MWELQPNNSFGKKPSGVPRRVATRFAEPVPAALLLALAAKAKARPTKANRVTILITTKTPVRYL